MKKTFISTILAALMCFWGCGCDNSLQSDQGISDIEQDETSKTPIEVLSQEEKEIFEALMIASDKFYNPQSIKVFSVKNLYGYIDATGQVNVEFDHYGPRCLIEISADNKAGGSAKKEYILWTSEWGNKEDEIHISFEPQLYHENGTIVEYNYLENQKMAEKERDFEDVDIGNINRALSQHWEDLGLN